MKNESICKNCKYCRNIMSSDIIFTERIDICIKHKIEWPFEKTCKDFENKGNEK